MAIQQLRQLAWKEVTLGEKTYTITKFPATKGIKYSKLVAKMLKPIFDKMASASAETNGEGGVLMSDLIGIFLDQFDNIDENVLKNMVMEATGMSSDTFEYEFSGSFMTLYQLIQEIVTFNFPDLFMLLGLQEMVTE